MVKNKSGVNDEDLARVGSNMSRLLRAISSNDVGEPNSCCPTIFTFYQLNFFVELCGL
jgi:hypothetical protein